MGTSERDFVERLKAGDPSAYEELIENYADMVYRVTYRILQDPQDAEDAMQETFLTVYRRIPTFRGDAKFSTWLYRIATNTALDLIRTRQRKQGQDIVWDESEEEGVPLPDEITPLPEELLLRQEVMELIEEGIAALSPKLRTAFVLYELEGLPMKEIASILGISENATKVRVHRARAQLQKFLAERLQEVAQ
ncbi:MAG: RNA polymerase sigma factor [Chloroflexi bacterium]|nr:RNA polymerase sigma factor [Chloroflexota bacterium]